MGQPRIFYSMAQDGLFFKFYKYVNPKTGIPTVGTLLTGIFIALVACLVDLESLANAISLGTLQVFTFVNAGVIILRMRPPMSEIDEIIGPSVEASPLVRDSEAAVMARSLGIVKKSSLQIHDSVLRMNLAAAAARSPLPRNVYENNSKPHVLTVLFTLGAVLASVGISNNLHYVLVCLSLLLCLMCALLLFQLPKSKPPETFNCPFVPGIPLLGILCNSYMMGSMPVCLLLKQKRERAIKFVFLNCFGPISFNFSSQLGQ